MLVCHGALNPQARYTGNTGLEICVEVLESRSLGGEGLLRVCLSSGRFEIKGPFPLPPPPSTPPHFFPIAPTRTRSLTSSASSIDTHNLTSRHTLSHSIVKSLLFWPQQPVSAVMGSYNSGRKVPNVSQYLANLNAVPSPHDVATQQDDNFGLDDDLAQFTNAEFLDFDAGADFLDQGMPEFGPNQSHRSRRQSSGNSDAKGMDFGSFNFADITAFPLDQTTTIAPPIQAPYINTSVSHTASAPFFTSPTTTTPSTQINPAPYPGQKHSRSSSASLSPTGPHTNQEPETAASRMAAEEDKRRRNTAASARFRVKKKQREQALEQTAKELEKKVNGLEQRIGQLETENEWLRGLVVEKNGGEKDDLKIKWKKLRGCVGEDRERGENERERERERKGGEGKKGVGTGSDEEDGRA
ncbi:hypothetical protein N7G274_006200 [Stereocaulon virgatum]|uniref:BZIP domain-containing protein n=1 Tax=Stereocaulon virgatum TaxID=373712 RepID=A0ABR4A609_9LECA